MAETIKERMTRKKNPAILPYVYYDKEFMKYEDAGLGIATNSLHYGTLVFGGIRGYVLENGDIAVFRLKDHHARLMNASKIMAYGVDYSYEAFYEIIKKTIELNDIKGNFYIRPFLFCDEAQVGPKLRNLTFDLAVYMMLMDEYADTSKGITFLTSSYTKYADISISTKAKVAGGYVNSMMATHQANIAGFDEALLFNSQGMLAEASVANTLVVHRGQVITPPIGSGALEGITIRSVIELLEYNNIPVEKADVDRSTLYTADELIITGTAMQIGHGSEVDGRKFTHSEIPGPIVALLKKEMAAVLTMQHPLSEKWMVIFKK
ncbi:branched-chain amino acid aminotransferase [Erysipelotrichaceae bacterium]|nr:branched-chain amino acid aminotransferase [Erysipelotrichaceae bacterium]